MKPEPQSRPVIVWFRQDLRTDDHPALHAASQGGRVVIPVFIWDPKSEGAWPVGGASKWWLHSSLASLGKTLSTLGSPLILRQGPPEKVLAEIAKATGAAGVHCSMRYEPSAKAQEALVRKELLAVEVSFAAHAGTLMHDPAAIRTGSGVPYKVYTPFAKAYRNTMSSDPPLSSPKILKGSDAKIPSDSLDDLKLLPAIDWAKTMRKWWQPGEEGARKRLSKFTLQAAQAYGENRDIPAEDGSSRLSAHLHWGEISPRRIWNEVSKSPAATSIGAQKYLAEILWRDFAYHVMSNFPRTAESPLRPEFERFPWEPSAERLKAWKRGQTGYPIVDAGMRQLWATGWMHNRVRMIVASFLVKHLLQDWQEGAKWFWETLVDADLSSNSLGWQWSAGCGADAAPYFRIFNPILQGEKFDSQGTYVREWIPELAKVPNEFIHQPWNAPPLVLLQSGVEFGENYPAPIVDHVTARNRALAALSAFGKQ